MSTDYAVEKNREEVEKLVGKIKSKYKIKIGTFFIFTTIIAVLIASIPFFIFLKRTGPVGFFVMVGLCMIYAFIQSLGHWSEEYEDEIKNEERRIRSENTISAKFTRFLHDEKERAHTILKGVGIAAEKQCFGINETKTADLPSIPLSNLVTTSRVENDERLTLVENELSQIDAYNPSSLVSTLRGYYNRVKSNEIDGIPLAPIEAILSKRNIDKSTLGSLLQDAKMLEEIYDDGKAYLEKEVGVMATGLGGEKRVNEELNMHEGMLTNIPNVRFEVDGQSVESDNIIISTKGIFTVEVKNYSPKGNYGLHITKDGQWLKVYSNGDSEPMKDVTSQMNRHIAYKQKLINSKWNEKFRNVSSSFILNPIFVIANDTVRIENETDLPIMRVSNIYHHIMKQPDVLTPEQVQQLAAIVRENSLPAKKYEVNSYIEGLRPAYVTLASNVEIISDNIRLLDYYTQAAIDEIQNNYI